MFLPLALVLSTTFVFANDTFQPFISNGEISVMNNGEIKVKKDAKTKYQNKGNQITGPGVSDYKYFLQVDKSGDIVNRIVEINPVSVNKSAGYVNTLKVEYAMNSVQFQNNKVVAYTSCKNEVKQPHLFDMPVNTRNQQMHCISVNEEICGSIKGELKQLSNNKEPLFEKYGIKTFADLANMSAECRDIFRLFSQTLKKIENVSKKYEDSFSSENVKLKRAFAYVTAEDFTFVAGNSPKVLVDPIANFNDLFAATDRANDMIQVYNKSCGHFQGANERKVETSSGKSQ